MIGYEVSGTNYGNIHERLCVGIVRRKGGVRRSLFPSTISYK